MWRSGSPLTEHAMHVLTPPTITATEKHQKTTHSIGGNNVRGDTAPPTHKLVLRWARGLRLPPTLGVQRPNQQWFVTAPRYEKVRAKDIERWAYRWPLRLERIECSKPSRAVARAKEACHRALRWAPSDGLAPSQGPKA